ncbi:MAG TPA: RNA-binding S4 domain-containing protein [Clostridiaceae bacterium]|nr:RNA-binding S4 domain-containing protein [Clostridiaceae bacterium]
MRIDKFLKVSRIIKRRTVASEMTQAGRVVINGVKAKPATNVKPGDIVEIGFGQGKTRIRVKEIRQTVRKEEAILLYDLLSDDD